MLTSHHLQQRAASPVKCLSRCETKSQFLLLRPWSHNESWPLRQKCYAFVQLACVLNSYLAANGVAKLWPNMCFMVQTFYYQLVIVTWKYHDVNLDNLISSFLSPSYICEILKETSSRFRWSGSKNKPTTHSCLWPRGIKTSLSKNLFFGIFQENTSSISSEWGCGDYKWTLYMWGRFFILFFLIIVLITFYIIGYTTCHPLTL